MDTLCFTKKSGEANILKLTILWDFCVWWYWGPLLHIKNGNLPRGVRKIESQIEREDLEKLKHTLPAYSKQSLLDSLRNAVALYRQLRVVLFDDTVILHKNTEKKVMDYFDKIESQK